MTAIEIRDVGGGELEAARALLTANGWAGRRVEAVPFAALVANSRQALVAVVAGEIVGFARAVGDGLSNGYLSMLVVDERFRHRGIARRLVERLVGDNPDMTWVLRARAGTEAFYEKLGFRRSTVAMERVRSVPPSR